jgi:hypothetical protein
LLPLTFYETINVGGLFRKYLLETWHPVNLIISIIHAGHIEYGYMKARLWGGSGNRYGNIRRLPIGIL